MHPAAERSQVASSTTMYTGTKTDVSTIPSLLLKMSGYDDNSSNDVAVVKIKKMPSSLSPDEEQEEFPIKVMTPPDCYVSIDS